jgi:endoglucanase
MAGALILSATLLLACNGANDPTGSDVASTASATPLAATDASSMAATMGIGVNIGNTFDNTTYWETGWGQPTVTQTYINGLASNGIKTVRLPVAWDTYAVNGVIQSDKMSRIREVTDWIVSAGMYCIVNIHWDGGWIDEGNVLSDTAKAKFESYWKQIAAEFDDVDCHLIFEALNEESAFYANGNQSQGKDYAPLNTLNQLFVTTVRATSGTGGSHYNPSRCLLISGYTTDFSATCVDQFTIPTDTAGAGKLFLSVHYYTPPTFCILTSDASWGKNRTTWGTEADKAELRSLFNTLQTFCAARGVTAIIGEYGVPTENKESASRTLWFNSVMQASLDRGMVPVLWDTGGDVNRTDGSLSSDFSAAIP